MEGIVEISSSLPWDIEEEKIELLQSLNHNIDVKKYIRKDHKSIKVRNRVLWSGRKLALDLLVNNRTYRINKIAGGDGANIFTSGVSVSVEFLTPSYPEVNEVVKNKVLESNVGAFGDINGNAADGYEMTLAASLHSLSDKVGNYRSGNSNLHINQLSLFASGADTPAMGVFPTGADIPFSSAILPDLSGFLNTGVNYTLFINWVVRIK